MTWATRFYSRMARPQTSTLREVARTHEELAAIGFFERYLTAWVALWIVDGIALGRPLPPWWGC
ncbi:MAG: hypothetical protein ACRC8Q_03150 [Aeromonas sp.]